MGPLLMSLHQSRHPGAAVQVKQGEGASPRKAYLNRKDTKSERGLSICPSHRLMCGDRHQRDPVSAQDQTALGHNCHLWLQNAVSLGSISLVGRHQIALGGGEALKGLCPKKFKNMKLHLPLIWAVLQMGVGGKPPGMRLT